MFSLNIYIKIHIVYSIEYISYLGQKDTIGYTIWYLWALLSHGRSYVMRELRKPCEDNVAFCCLFEGNGKLARVRRGKRARQKCPLGHWGSLAIQRKKSEKNFFKKSEKKLFRHSKPTTTTPHHPQALPKSTSPSHISTFHPHH